MTADADRRSRLLGLKLAALVREHAPATELAPAPFALGAALRAGDSAWVLLDEAADDGRGLGAAILWTQRAGLSSLNVAADAPLTIVARRAGEFTMPIEVWSIDDRQLVPVEAAPICPPPAARPDHLRFVADIDAAGAVPAIEHGVVTGEVRGLEVCRVVDIDGPDGPTVRLEVGVGATDRDAFAVIHGDVPTREALATVVSAVANARGAASPGHPLNRLAPERFARWRLEQEPWLVGMASVEPAQPPVPRPGLKERSPCSALGHRVDDAPAVIVCSVGVDLDLIPYAADARLAAGEPGVETIVALPERDLLPATRQLAAALRHSVTLVALPSV